MKKKRNLLTIISSILGVFAICGFSVFGLLSRSREKTQKVSAENYQILYSETFDHLSLPYGSSPYRALWSSNNEITFEYCKVYGDDRILYNFHLYGKLAPQLVYNNDNYYLFPQYYNNLFSFDLYSGNFTSHLNYGDVVTLSFENIVALHVYQELGFFQFRVRFNVGNVNVTSDFVLGANLYKEGNVLVNDSTIYESFTVNYNQLTTPFTCRTYTITFDDNDYDLGFEDGYNSGYDSGYQDGVSAGSSTGYQDGFNDGVSSQETAISNAYSEGYSAGYTEGSSQDDTVATIFSGILQVAMVPVNFFLAIFNFEILGINLSAFIRALFTVVLTIIVIKTVMGKGGGSSDS